MRELTCADAKILKDLLKDGRKSFTQIADECGETKASMCKRYKEMEKSGIIVGSTIQLNYASLGYLTVGTIGFKIHPEDVDNAVKTIQKVPNVFSAWKQNNNTVVVVATLKNIDEFNRLKDYIKRAPSVYDVVTNIWMGIRNIPHNLKITKENCSIKENNDLDLTIKGNNKTIEIDEIDKQIIEKLAKDGQTPFAKMGKELNISTNTVIRKYERLKQKGIINVSIQINPINIGYPATASFNLAFQSQGSLTSIVDKLSAIPDIYLFIKTSGQYDLAIFSLIKDLEQVLSLQEQISEIAEISKIEIALRRPRTSFPSYKQYISTF